MNSTPSVTTDLIAGLANNGPWALAAAFLLKKLLDILTAERGRVDAMMTTFQSTLQGFNATIDKLSDAIDELRDEIRDLKEKTK